MQQVILPSLYRPSKQPVLTPAFPLVRRRTSVTLSRPRRFFAGLLFGVLMSLTLVLLGFSARLYLDQHPELFREAGNMARAWMRY